MNELVEMMEELRSDGWLVVLKCMPRTHGWIIEGSRSEYDAPCPDTAVAVGEWCCQLSDMDCIGKRPHRRSVVTFHANAVECVRKAMSEATKRATA